MSRKLDEDGAFAWLDANTVGVLTYVKAKVDAAVAEKIERDARDRANEVTNYAERLRSSVAGTCRRARTQPYAARLAELKAEINALETMIEGLALSDVKTLTLAAVHQSWIDNAPKDYKNDPKFMADVVAAVAATEKLSSHSMWSE
jgi:hypothetical protein